jgi:hypothetical protein
MILLALLALVETCQYKANLLGTFFLKISQLLPESPPIFKVQYLIDQINLSTPWGLGGIIIELLSGVIDYLKLIVAWKFVKLLIGVLGGRL